jgi:hypothetical protein
MLEILRLLVSLSALISHYVYGSVYAPIGNALKEHFFPHVVQI